MISWKSASLVLPGEASSGLSFPESLFEVQGGRAKEKEGKKRKERTNSGAWSPKNKTSEMCVRPRTNRTESSVPCQSSGPGLSEQAGRNTFMAGEKVGRGGSLHQGDTWGGCDAQGHLAFLLLLPSLPEHSGEAARRQGSSPGRRRRAVLSRARSGVTPGQCPPVPAPVTRSL